METLCCEKNLVTRLERWFKIKCTSSVLCQDQFLATTWCLKTIALVPRIQHPLLASIDPNIQVIYKDNCRQNHLYKKIKHKN